MGNKGESVMKKHVLAGGMSSINKRYEISSAPEFIHELLRKSTARLLFKSRRHTGIGERIRPLIESLNATGVASTTASCQGHGWPFVRVFPYVLFNSHPMFAAFLANLLRDDALASARRLHYVWNVSVHLDHELKPSFRILLAEYVPRRFVWHKRLAEDFIGLANIASVALQTYYSQDTICAGA